MIRQTDWSGVTTRNIRSRKWALIAAALLAAAADIVALVVTAVEGAAVKFIIPAALLLAADAVFTLLVCLSNYRFKYTAVQWKAYVIVVAVLTAVAAIVNFALGELAMTAAAAVILILSHAVAIVVVRARGEARLAAKAQPRRARHDRRAGGVARGDGAVRGVHDRQRLLRAG